MIDRAILDDPNKPFDFFNDLGDTLDWLRSIGRFDLAAALSQRREEFTNQERERIRLDYELRLTPHAIARMYGRDVESVLQVLMLCGVSLRQSTIVQIDQVTRRNEIASLYRQGMSLRQIGRCFALSSARVRQIVLSAGQPLRPPGFASPPAIAAGDGVAPMIAQRPGAAPMSQNENSHSETTPGRPTR